MPTVRLAISELHVPSLAEVEEIRVLAPGRVNVCGLHVRHGRGQVSRRRRIAVGRIHITDHLRVSSEAEGTTFTITLPKAPFGG